MSEQDKKASGTSAGGSSVVMMEQSNTSRMKQPYRPTDLQDDSKELHHKRSKAPAVPSVTEELKGKTENMENRDQIESDAISTEKQKQAAVKKLSSIGKRRESSPETIKMAALDVESKKEIIALSSHAKPAHIGKLPSVASPKSGELEKADAEKADDDSITEEIAELRTEVVAKKESDWSDVEEAGGLPRSESRASRVSRAVRQLLCCGTLHGAPSEDDISTPNDYINGI